MPEREGAWSAVIQGQPRRSPTGLKRTASRAADRADPLTWTEIAEWGKHERLLDAKQARLLRRLQTATPQAARRPTA